MADNYTQFSEVLKVDEGDVAWLEERMRLFENPPDDEDTEAWDLFEALCIEYNIEMDDPELIFNSEIDNDEVWFYSHEGGDPWHVAKLVQDLFRARHPDSCFKISWSFSCSKPKVGEFSGGSAFVTAESIEICDPFIFLEDKEREWELRAKGQ